MNSKFWTREGVINNILYLHSMNEDLSCSAIQSEHKDIYMGAVHNFGSWKEAVTFAGLDYEKIRKRQAWTREKVVNEIQRLHAEGEDLSCSRMQREHSRLAAAAFRKFGNWKTAVTVSGLDYERIRRFKSWNKKKVIEGIKKAKAEAADLNWSSVVKGPYSDLAHAARKRFGTWKKALEAAGFEWDSISKYRYWDKEKVIEYIKDLHERGVPLNAQNIQKTTSVLYHAAVRRFETWQNAIEAAGIDYSKVALR